MVIQVNQELCTGCGACIDACTVEAIHLMDQRAVIDHELCTHCEACVDACPNGAITALSLPVHSSPAVVGRAVDLSAGLVTDLPAALPATEPRIVPISTKTELPETAPPTRTLAQVAGTALAYLGREIVPRVLDVLITSLERKFARPAVTIADPLSTPSQSLTRGRRGKRRQARYRSGRMVHRNSIERR